jgi:hypothetical protein
VPLPSDNPALLAARRGIRAGERQTCGRPRLWYASLTRGKRQERVLGGSGGESLATAGLQWPGPLLRPGVAPAALPSLQREETTSGSRLSCPAAIDADGQDPLGVMTGFALGYLARRAKGGGPEDDIVTGLKQ